MLRLAAMLYGIVAMTLAGVGVIAVLGMGVSQVLPMLLAALAGAIAALPVSYAVARRIAGAP